MCTKMKILKIGFGFLEILAFEKTAAARGFVRVLSLQVMSGKDQTPKYLAHFIEWHFLFSHQGLREGILVIERRNFDRVIHRSDCNEI